MYLEPMGDAKREPFKKKKKTPWKSYEAKAQAAPLKKNKKPTPKTPRKQNPKQRPLTLKKKDFLAIARARQWLRTQS
jgi:hypothetical protein